MEINEITKEPENIKVYAYANCPEGHWGLRTD